MQQYRYHVVAVFPGGEQKIIYNQDESAATQFVSTFMDSGTVTTKWGAKALRRAALELRVYRTPSVFAKKRGHSFDTFIKGHRNIYASLAKEVRRRRGPTYRVFVVMPLQGREHGTQDEQRIFKEYTDRFSAISDTLADLDCYAVRIDREVPLDDLVDRIKSEIRQAKFVVADLTDERPSCYFECGYAEASGCPIIYVASEQSVLQPGSSTRIHFDIHKNVFRFRNTDELKAIIRSALDKNQSVLLSERSPGVGVAVE